MGCCYWHFRFWWLDANRCYSMAVHFLDYEAAALIVEGLAAFGHFLEAGEDESGEGFEAFVLRQDQIVLAFEVAYVDRPI